VEGRHRRRTTSAAEQKPRVTRGEERRGRGCALGGPFYFGTTVNYLFAGLFGLVEDLLLLILSFRFVSKMA
jgi:hypothetical protein